MLFGGIVDGIVWSVGARQERARSELPNRKKKNRNESPRDKVKKEMKEALDTRPALRRVA